MLLDFGESELGKIKKKLPFIGNFIVFKLSTSDQVEVPSLHCQSDHFLHRNPS